MRTNYMMNVDDVMEELGVKRSKAYSILSSSMMNWQRKDMQQFVERFHVPTGKQNFMDALSEQFKEVLRCQLTRTQNREPGM